jgi:adenylate cyclase
MDRRHRWLVGVGLALAAGLVALGLGRVPVVRGIEWLLYDLRMRRTIDPAHAPANIVLIEIDEASLRDLEPFVGRWPWPRVLHAHLLDYLARAPARLVVYDILFLEHDRRLKFALGGADWSGEESDQALVESTAKAGNVIYAADATFAGANQPDTVSTAAGGADSTAAGGVGTAAGAGLGARAGSGAGGAPAASAGSRASAESAASSGLGAASPAGAGSAAGAVSAALSAMAGLRDPGYRLEGPIEEAPTLTPPFAELARASLGVGHNRFVLDDEGALRRVVPFLRSGGRDVPLLGVSAYLFAERVPPAQVRLDASGLTLGTRHLPLLTFAIPRFAGEAGAREGRHALVRFRGPAILPNGKTPTYRSYSFADLLLSEDQLRDGQKPRVDPAAFRDAIVFVGLTAAGLHDVFMTPLGSTGQIPGTQIHATVTDQLLSSMFLAPASWPLQLGVLFACALLVAVLTVALPMRIGFAAMVVTAAGVAILGLLLFRRGVWLVLVEPFIAIALASTGGLAWQYFVEGREKRQVKRLFSRYLSKDVYEQVMKNPALAELGGSRREMSVLFSDVRGFTALSERGDPEALVQQLNEYFSRMVEIVFAHRGTLDKFVGDMVMALFGAPLDDEEHADHAVRTALAMTTGLEELNARWQAQGRPKLGIGIGVNTGEMIAGTIGAETVRSYTVIGDAVNLGARLESLNKDYQTQIIISEFTARQLKGRYNLRPLGAVVVKGKTVPVEIFEVVTAPSGE